MINICEKKIKYSCYIFVIFILFSTYREYFLLNVYGHDEVHYYESFRFKLIEEGRWFNYILHHLLRAFPIPSWGLLLIGVSFILFYSLLSRTVLPEGVRVLFAASVVTSPPFIEQSLWPATTFPSILAICILSLSQKIINYRTIYVLAGIILFGGMQNIYFLTPLIFIPTFLDEKISLHTLSQHFMWWVAGCLIGILVMLMAVFTITGQFGLEIADWRQATPVHNIQSMFHNIIYAIRSFINNVYDMLNISHFIFSVSVISVSIYINFYFRKMYILSFISIFAVAFSYFGFSIPLAPVIQMRTLLPLSVSLLLLIIIFSGKVMPLLFNYIVLAAFCAAYSIYGYGYIHQHREVTEHYRGTIYRILDRNIRQLDAVILEGRLPDRHPYAYFFNSAPLMHSVMYSLGASSYWDCREGSKDPRCKTEINATVKNRIAMDGGELLFSVDEVQKIGVIQFVQSSD